MAARRQHLFILRELVKRDFQGRYAGSALGVVWAVLQPLWQLLLFTFVFAVVMKVSLVGERTASFGAFLFCGLLPWLAVHEGLTRSATSVADNAPLVKRQRFPAELLVLAAVLTALLHEAVAALVFAVVLAVTGELSFLSLPLLALAVPIQVAFTVGLGLIFAALHPFFRDLLQILGMVLSAWFYLTPIVYPLSYVPARLREWIELNPMTLLVELYRAAFLGSATALSAAALPLIAFAAGVLAIGVGLFRRLKPAFSDVL